MKNNKGITLIALVVTIIILLILAGVTLNYGTESIKNAKLETLKTNMMLIKAKAMEYVEQANFKAGTSNEVTDTVKEELKGTEIEDTFDYITLGEKQYLYNVNGILDEIGLKDVQIDSSKQEKYLVVYDVKNATAEIYNTIGAEIEGNVVHDLTTLQGE